MRLHPVWSLMLGAAFLTAPSLWVDAIHPPAIAQDADQARSLDEQASAAYQNNDLQRALELWKESLEIFQAVGDRANEAKILGNLGQVYWGLTEHVEAAHAFDVSVNIFEELGEDVGPEVRLNEGRAAFTAGEFYFSYREPSFAIPYFEQSLVAFQELGDRSSQATVMLSLGVSYLQHIDIELAVDYFEQSSELFGELIERADDPDLARSGRAQSLGNLGFAYSALGEEERAISTFEEAITLFEAIGDVESTSRLLQEVEVLQESQP